MKRAMIGVVAILILLLGLSSCGKGQSKEPEAISWHQCPEAVRAYLDYVAANPYSEGDDSETAILNFAPKIPNQANTKPVGKTVGEVTYYDNTPGEPEKLGEGENEGTLTALDSLRWINTTLAPPSGNAYSRGYNCRDLGGWPCDGGTVRYGLLIRSGELNPEDRELMVDTLGIQTEINLLPVRQQARTDSAWGIDYIANPTDIDFAYQINNNVQDQWALYLRGVMDSISEWKPVVFHCGAGADKTGTLAVMLLGLLGCDSCSIDQDYELTTFSAYSDWRNRTNEAYIGYLENIRAFPLAEGLSDTFQNHCISFALSLGITVNEINEFRAICTEGTPEIITVSSTEELEK